LKKRVRPDAYSASFFIVGMSPMFGLPVGPWAVAILMVLADVDPLQSFFGQ
jgi:hypothetical protein